LIDQGLATLWLDSDDLRAVMTPNATYSPLERDYFYTTLAHIARRATAGQARALISATAARRTYRDSLRQRVPHFFELWLTADPETLRQRDVKGLYFQADSGETTALPGVGVPFEAPTEAEFTLDTSTLDAQGVFDQALSALSKAIPA